MRKTLILLIVCFYSNNLIANDLIKTLSDAFDNNTMFRSRLD